MNKETLLKNVTHLMSTQHIAVISTVDDGSQPQGATIFCVRHEDGMIFFPTRTGSRKYKNIQKNSTIALVVNHPTDAITMQLHGLASEVTNADDVQHAIDHLMCCSASDVLKKHWLPPVKRLQAGHFTIMQIRPTWIRYSDFRDEERKGEEFVNEITF